MGAGLRKALISEVRASFGKQLRFFRTWTDWLGVSSGEQKLVSSSDDAAFLIRIITPNYFASQACRQELKQFVDRENATGFKEFNSPDLLHRHPATAR